MKSPTLETEFEEICKNSEKKAIEDFYKNFNERQEEIDMEKKLIKDYWEKFGLKIKVLKCRKIRS